MTSNKNIIACALYIAIQSPLQCQESTDNIHRLTNQQQTVINDIASAAAEGVITAVENAIDTAQTQHPISLEQAQSMLKLFIDSLVEGSVFEINDVKYIIQ